MGKKLVYLFLFCSLLGVAQDDLALKQGDISISFGAGSNRYLESENFTTTTPLEAPIELNVGLNKYFEVGTEWSITFFNNKTQNGTTRNIDTTKNKSIGNMINYSGSIKYSLNNNYRSNGYLVAGGGFSDLNKRTWIGGKFHEQYGEGYNWMIGGGLRYQLGNMYDDVFPWFFDFSLTYTRYKHGIMQFLVDNELQPRVESGWDDLNFGSIDVAIRIGYRIRYKKK